MNDHGESLNSAMDWTREFILNDSARLRRTLLEYIDGDEKLELHLNRKDAASVIDIIDQITATASFVLTKLDGLTPPHIPVNLPADAKVVSLADFRSKRTGNKKF